jgi:hypothetical protein
MGLYESLDSIHILYSFFTNSFQTDIRRYGWTDVISDCPFLGCALQLMKNVEKYTHFGWTENDGASYGASIHYRAVGAVSAVIGYSF